MSAATLLSSRLADVLGGTGGASFSSVVGPGLSENLRFQVLKKRSVKNNFSRVYFSLQFNER